MVSGWVLRRHRLCPCLAGGKPGNYWPNVRALAFARENGFDETLIVNIERVVISAAMANVFFLIEGILRTPAADIGVRQGVVRQWITRMTPVREDRFVARRYQRSRGMLPDQQQARRDAGFS